jgi:hypothetical protein
MLLPFALHDHVERDGKDDHRDEQREQQLAERQQIASPRRVTDKAQDDRYRLHVGLVLGATGILPVLSRCYGMVSWITSNNRCGLPMG